ncbi:MAG: NAD(P)-dependent oxidoreductase [Candidatus Caldarchaeum sp.]|nr:NAD(P)-dependent oxidoreductase [Candidatus Caldarchaeum sp.]
MPGQRTIMPEVGFIGLGRMGSRIARNILKGGFPLVVWNRTREKAEEFAKLGATLSDSPKKVAERCSIVISMLTDPVVTENVLTGTGDMKGASVLDGIQRGKIVVDMSTNHPMISRRIAEKVREKGGDFVEAPVVGGAFIAEQARLTILAAGRQESVEAVSKVLQTTSQKILHVGEIGAASAIKLILNLHLWINMAGFAECVVIASKLGVKPKTLAEVFNNTVFKNYVTEYKSQKIIDDEWSPVATIDLAVKDIKLALEVARDVDVPTFLGSVTKDLYVATAQMGMRDLDVMAVAITYGKLTNEKISKLV